MAISIRLIKSRTMSTTSRASLKQKTLKIARINHSKIYTSQRFQGSKIWNPQRKNHLKENRDKERGLFINSQQVAVNQMCIIKAAEISSRLLQGFRV